MVDIESPPFDTDAIPALRRSIAKDHPHTPAARLLIGASITGRRLTWECPRSMSANRKKPGTPCIMVLADGQDTRRPTDVSGTGRASATRISWADHDPDRVPRWR